MRLTPLPIFLGALGWQHLLSPGLHFAVQSLGERCRIIRYFPNTFTVEEWYQKTVEFRKRQDYDRHKDVFNRLSLIKEACGNTYLALIMATIIYAFTKCAISGEVCLPVAKVPFFGPIIFEIIIIAALCAMHFRHVDRQYKYMKAVLEAPDSPGPNSPKS